MGTSVIPASTADTATEVVGAIGPTPNRNADITRVSMSAMPIPLAMPMVVNHSPWRKDSFLTSPSWAPSAIRTPISRVRCAAAQATTP